MSENGLMELCGDAGLWAIEKSTRRGWHWRMTAVALDPGGLLIVSPIRGLPDAVHEALAARGGAKVLLAPNHFHYLGLAEYRERYPGAEAVCSDQARPRIARKAAIDCADLPSLEAALPAHVSVLAPPALRTGELWLRVETGRGVAWVVSDAFFNLAAHPTGAVGLFCRVTQTTAGLRIGRTFTTLAVGDRRAYRDWLLAQIERDQPRLLVPGHGDVLESDELSARLADLVTARLG